MKRYGSLPLVYQPGERWLYNSGTEILSVLIARVAGTTFGEFLRDRIFAPLDMKDTAFSVPESKRDRFATSYMRDHATQKLNVFDDPVTGKFSSPPGILLTQRMTDSPQPPRALVDFWTLAYQAIDD
jgi:CubicO group peptidase (beta-lactamase class C family)